MQKVGTLADFAPGTMQGIVVEGERVVLINEDGRLYALSNECPHAGLPMTAGYVDRKAVVCPFHGSSFRLDTGEALGGPATDGLLVYAVQVDGEDVLVGRSG